MGTYKEQSQCVHIVFWVIQLYELLMSIVSRMLLADAIQLLGLIIPALYLDLGKTARIGRNPQ